MSRDIISAVLFFESYSKCVIHHHTLYMKHPNGWHHQNICWPAARFIIHISLQAFQFDNACFYCPCRFSSVSAFTSTQISYVCTYMTWDLLYRKWNLLWEAGICACDRERERETSTAGIDVFNTQWLQDWMFFSCVDRAAVIFQSM